jgi:hypothetical protein
LWRSSTTARKAITAAKTPAGIPAQMDFQTNVSLLEAQVFVHLDLNKLDSYFIPKGKDKRILIR